MRLERKRQPGRHDPVRLGLDLGSFETRFVLPGTGEGRETQALVLPTLIGYTRSGGEPAISCVGRRAASRRHRMRVLNPLLVEDADGDTALYDFAGHLRDICLRHGGANPWGVVSCSVATDPVRAARKRIVANEIFERFSFVDDVYLLALGLGSREICQHSIIVDVGYTSVRAAVMRGQVPERKEVFEVPVGGKHVDDELRIGLTVRYPELLVTDYTLTQIKERLSFVDPASNRSRLQIWLRGAQKVVDVTDIVSNACEKLIQPIIEVIRQVLAHCVSDHVEAFLRNILMVGGGSTVKGIVDRVQQELRTEGFEEATVRKPLNPTLLTARGALRWAQLLEEDRWSIPIFSYRPIGYGRPDRRARGGLTAPLGLPEE